MPGHSLVAAQGDASLVEADGRATLFGVAQRV